MQGGKYENKWEHDSVDKRVWSVHTEPKVALISVDRLGGRAMLIGEVRNRPESVPDPNGQRQCAVGSDHLPRRRDGREGVFQH